MDIKNLNPGDLIKIKTKDKIFEGILLPETESRTDFLFIKLKSGYNIGIEKGEIEKIELEKKGERKEEKIFRMENKGEISILATGGTIASKIDYITGAVKPAFTAEELINAIPEISEINEKINAKQIFNKFSENLTPDDWITIAENIYKEIKKGVKGIVIPHGTDTMHYSSAACSFMLKNLKIPVVFTGAQRSSDRGSSDATLNLINSIYFSNFGSLNKGVYVLMHETINDDWCVIFKGAKVRKMHTSRRDAFKGEIYARINFYERKFEKFKEDLDNKINENQETELDTKICKDVFLLKYFPGLNKEIFEILCERYKGIVIEGTGLGHVNEELIYVIKKLIDDGKFIAMASQTIFGRVNMNVYATGRKLLNAGVISCEDMFPETAYIKLMFALGHYNNYQEIKEFMQKNIVGEISERRI